MYKRKQRLVDVTRYFLAFLSLSVMQLLQAEFDSIPVMIKPPALENGKSSNVDSLGGVYQKISFSLFLAPNSIHHKKSINAVTFSPDGSQLASASDDKTIKFWNVETGVTVQTLKGINDAIIRIEYTLNGKQLVSISKNKTITLWDVKTGRRLFSEKNGIISLNGELYATGVYESILKVRNIQTNDFLYMLFADHLGVFTQLNFSPDARHLATASTSNGEITIWDISTGTQLNSLTGLNGSVRMLTYNTNGTYIASLSFNYLINIWNILSGKKINTLNEKRAGVDSITFNPDGTQLAIVYHNKSIKFWDIKTGNLLLTLRSENGLINKDIKYSPNGKLLAYYVKGHAINIIDTKTGFLVHSFKTKPMNIVHDFDFHPDGKQIVTANSDKTIKLWDISEESQIPKF